MTPAVITGRTFWYLLTEEQRQDMRALLGAHGYEGGHDVLAVAHDVIDMPLLRLTIIDRDEQGRVIPDDLGRISQHDVEVPLRSSLPAWWRA